MVLKDDEIEKSRKEEQSQSTRLKRDAAEKHREHMRLAAELQRIMKARDERAFSAALRRAGILEGSPEWTNAWKAYRSFGK